MTSTYGLRSSSSQFTSLLNKPIQMAKIIYKDDIRDITFQGEESISEFRSRMKEKFETSANYLFISYGIGDVAWVKDNDDFRTARLKLETKEGTFFLLEEEKAPQVPPPYPHQENPFQAGLKRMREEGLDIKENWKRHRALAIIDVLSPEQRKAVPRFEYGVQSYESILRDGLFFVGNTKLFTNPPGSCLFLCRPKRHGKTLLCSLAQCFYDIINQSQFAEMFPNVKADLFTPRPTSFMVLPLSFDGLQPGDVTAPDCGAVFNRNFQDRLRMALNDFCDTYGLKYSCPPSENAIHMFLTVVSLVNKLGFPMMIVIDEYDSSVNSALLSPTAAPFRDHLKTKTSAYFSFFTTLKTALKVPGNRALVVGVAPLAIADFTSGFNIAFHMTWDAQYQDVCGILVDDIEPVILKIAETHGWNTNKCAEVKKKLIDSYDGYNFGGPLRVFNSGQLVNCLQCLFRTGAFPENLTDLNTNLSESVLRLLSEDQNDEFYLLLLQLLTGPVKIALPDVFVIDEVRSELDMGVPNTLLSLMVYYGALTRVKIDNETYAKIPNHVARIVFVERLVDNLQKKIHLTEPTLLRSAVKSFLEEFTLDSLVGYLLNSSLLPQENHGDVVHSLESTFKTRFEVLLLAGLPENERSRLMNEFCFYDPNAFLGQADTVIIPPIDGKVLLLIEFKNTRISDLVDTPKKLSWENQVKKSETFLDLEVDQLKAMELNVTQYNSFETIGERWDDACKELENNARKLRYKFPGETIVGFVLYRVGLHRVIYERFDDPDFL